LFRTFRALFRQRGPRSGSRAKRCGLTSDLAEIPLDVFLRFFLFGVAEDLAGVAELHQITRPGAIRGIDVQKARLIGHPLGLGEIVSHNGDREAFLQLLHEVLDLAR